MRSRRRCRVKSAPRPAQLPQAFRLLLVVGIVARALSLPSTMNLPPTPSNRGSAAAARYDADACSSERANGIRARTCRTAALERRRPAVGDGLRHEAGHTAFDVTPVPPPALQLIGEPHIGQLGVPVKDVGVVVLFPFQVVVIEVRGFPTPISRNVQLRRYRDHARRGGPTRSSSSRLVRRKCPRWFVPNVISNPSAVKLACLPGPILLPAL